MADGTTKAVAQLRAGDMTRGHDGGELRIEANFLIEGRSSEFVHIPRNVLGSRQDLFIRPAHPILLEDTELPAEELLSLEPSVQLCRLPRPARIHTLITEKVAFVDCEGVAVKTWSVAAWKKMRVPGRYL